MWPSLVVPLMAVGGEAFVGPAREGAYTMIVAAERCKVGADGRPVLGIGNAMLDVTVEGGHPTPGKHARAMKSERSEESVTHVAEAGDDVEVVA